ncbi:tRNA 4-thiouridine(8) synthase ThiI [Clostridium perfringens]|uniref:Thiamin biosynthesis protein ThiI n=1 Tax=Clostridium perfringens E str. JGS1987 TaxID=451755 RepID=B1BRR8_CLOPF|nr:tRNA 4-thiouridine(8) synthase ThiI [Clostridium perfringens]EDT15592.1 thiamin biosynthesis protein ThiI [Clostridium perfringens E str. JGS1987]EJT6558827.1 tRNA 4-thiouridine(8) synthase ThiI [Clostridium perfringens]
MTRALAMVSGGLDSILAAKLIKDQGIEVIGICFKSYFFNEENAKRMCKQIDMPLEVVDFSEEHFEMVKDPKHGRGKNMNPCIDCHAMMMRYSGELLKKFDADFIITGEVLNQRPMSQNRQALNTVKKESGFSEKILRPLCALNLEPTEMELNGLVDREKLLKISGRSRKTQMELAEKWNIVDYPSPAGGCKLTEPGYAIRLSDLLDNQETVAKDEIEVLKYGRHMRVSPKNKVIVARNGEEWKEIVKFKREDDILVTSKNSTGAPVILRGEFNKEDLETAARICGRYCKEKDSDAVEINYEKNGEINTITITPFKDEELKKYMINQ